MGRTRILGFNPDRMKKQMLSIAVEEQTNRLIDYATNEIKRLGDMIQTYNSDNHMDRTGNLLNSLCWGVCYNGKMKGYGFYRDPVTHPRGLDKTSISYLHEWFPNDREEVNGRQRAENFIKSFKGRPNKWSVFFAILAPYWGYWESGFTMKGGGGIYGQGNRKELVGKTVTPKFSAGYRQFQVMTHIYDDVRMDLKPAETHLTVYIPEYSYKSRKYKNKKGITKIGLMR